MTDFSTYWSVLTVVQPIWGMSNEQAGWISGIIFGGYVLLVPFLVAITDLRDARGIVVIGCGLSFIGLVGMALLADGFWPALFWRAILGAGLAGTYMPGLKILTDRLPASTHPRAIAFYTASFSIGSGVSYAVSGLAFSIAGWQGAFALVALGPLLSAALVFLLVRPRAPEPDADRRRSVLDVRPVLRTPTAMAYVLAYAGHMGELFAMRSWLVPLLVVSLGFGGEVDATVIAMAVSFVAVFASIGGSEIALRIGRVRLIATAMAISVFVGAAMSFSVTLPFWLVVVLCLLYAATIQADSAVLTAGAVAMAPPGHRGATMAVRSVVGFSDALFGPMLAGIALDVSGGQTSVLAWGLTFTLIGGFGLLGLASLLLLGCQARGCALR